MLRRLQAFLVVGVWTVAMPAAAQDPVDDPGPADATPAPEGAAPAAPDEPAGEPAAEPAEEPMEEALPSAPVGAAPTAPTGPAAEAAPTGVEPAAPALAEAADPGTGLKAWRMGLTGYFRAPMAMGISNRPGPDDLEGNPALQVSYGPNRTIDANYYSFAYTRLQEQDWVELFVTAKREHVEAAVGWMGYWFQSAGFRNPDAGWFPSVARLTIDTNFGVTGPVKPKLALTGGSWWPRFGYFEKYDTYTLGQFRQLGAQLKFSVALPNGITLNNSAGFGTGRDGSFVYQINPPIYGAKTGLNLIQYEHLQFTFKEYVDVGLHVNTQWTRDPNLTPQVIPGKAYSDVAKAHLTTVGGELGLRAPYAGRLWLSPSVVSVRNGWALANNGTEVMHSLGGAGFATNYMGWTNSPADSTGTGRTFNFGALYENTLSSVLGKTPGATPEVTLNVFGLLAAAKLDLPAGSLITQDSIRQLKYGADVELQALKWLGIMARYDEVVYDLEHSGYVFSAITPRLTFSSHFLSGESIYIQYSRYRYGDRMLLAGQWPWGQQLVAGNDIIQNGPYARQKPDMDVIKFQANVAF